MCDKPACCTNGYICHKCPPTPKPVLVEDSSSDEDSDTETVPDQKVSNETLGVRRDYAKC